MNDMGKNILLWLVIAVVLLTVFQNFNVSRPPEEVPYSTFLGLVNGNQVRSVEVDGLIIRGERSDGISFETIQPQIVDKALIDDMVEHNVAFQGERPEQQSIWMQLLVASFPILVIIAVFMFFMRQMQGGAGGKGGPLSFGKSKAKLLGEDQIKTTFADVAGVDEAKEEVKELVDFLREPGKFQKLGGRIPRGTLLVGSPGTGKTLLAKAIAGEAKVPFFSISGSDFVEMFVGVGASRVRDMFEQAKKATPCIIFIDEIDAVGRHRGAGLGGGTGSGTAAKLVEIARKYMESKGKPPRVGVIASLPEAGEGQQICRNALQSLKWLLDAKVSPAVLVDNYAVRKLYKPSFTAVHSTINSTVAQLFHIFNQLAAVHSPFVTFDRSELAQLLDNGITVMGAAALAPEAISSPADISAAIRDQLANSVLAEVDIRKGKKGVVIFVGDIPTLDRLSMDYFDAGFTQMSRTLGSEGGDSVVVHRGVYPGSAPGLQAYAMISELQPPAKKLTELAKVANISKADLGSEVAKFLGVDD